MPSLYPVGFSTLGFTSGQPVVFSLNSLRFWFQAYEAHGRIGKWSWFVFLLKCRLRLERKSKVGVALWSATPTFDFFPIIYCGYCLTHMVAAAPYVLP